MRISDGSSDVCSSDLPAQGGEVAQVLRDGEVEVQGLRLEHDAERGEGAAARLAQAVAGDLDVAASAVEEAGNQEEQSRLAGAVGPEQGGDADRPAGEGHLLKLLRLATSVGGAAAAGHQL